MHYTWPVLRLVWSAAIVVYLVLIIVSGRVSSREKKLNGGLFVLVVAFVGIRVFARLVFHGGLISQFALVLAGLTAAIGILFRIKVLISRNARTMEGEAVEVKLKAEG